MDKYARLLENFEPVTLDNLHELKVGDWIWDSHDSDRSEVYFEKMGFSEIIGLDIHYAVDESYTRVIKEPSNKYLHLFYPPFNGTPWLEFEEGRFYRFKK